MKKRVTGLGGVFFQAKNPKDLKKWYEKHLEIYQPNEYGGIFEWRDFENPDRTGHTVWSPFENKPKYFEPSNKTFMFNYRVENLEELLKVLKEEGVEVVGEIEEFEYGKFGWILDPEGTKIELWEPNDEVFREVNDMKKA